MCFKIFKSPIFGKVYKFKLPNMYELTLHDSGVQAWYGTEKKRNWADIHTTLNSTLYSFISFHMVKYNCTLTNFIQIYLILRRNAFITLWLCLCLNVVGAFCTKMFVEKVDKCIWRTIKYICFFVSNQQIQNRAMHFYLVAHKFAPYFGLFGDLEWIRKKHYQLNYLHV